MTGLGFIENINNVDDDLIFEAEHWVSHKARNLRIAVTAAVSAACVCLAIGLASGFAKEGKPSIGDKSSIIWGDTGCIMLPGADEIYPTVMVNGELYEWLFGKAIIDELPAGSVYYGKIFHSNRTTPEYDREFVSVFPVSGRIFIDPNESLIYLELTTDWLEHTIVTFEPISTSERYQYEMGVKAREPYKGLIAGILSGIFDLKEFQNRAV